MIAWVTVAILIGLTGLLIVTSWFPQVLSSF
jgi:hypothetical protein